jgi:hypothetical protein
MLHEHAAAPAPATTHSNTSALRPPGLSTALLPRRGRMSPACHASVANSQSAIPGGKRALVAAVRPQRTFPDFSEMPKKQRPELIQLEARIAIVRRIVADQQALIVRLLAGGEFALDAERTLQMYLSSLRHLEDHARRFRRRDGRHPKK